MNRKHAKRHPHAGLPLTHVLAQQAFKRMLDTERSAKLCGNDKKSDAGKVTQLVS